MSTQQMNSYVLCPDGTMCEHSSACVSNPYDEGSYYCDCANAPFKSAVAGLYCEFIATTYCNTQQTVSRSAFCVNGGTCKAIVSGSQAFPGCQCPKGYIGTHCEYVGIQPGGYPYDGSAAPLLNNYQNTSHELRAGIKALIVLVVFAVVGMLGFVMYKSRKSSNAKRINGASMKDSSTSLHLEADGGVLSEAVQESALMSEENGSGHRRHQEEHMNGEDDHHAVQLI